HPRLHGQGADRLALVLDDMALPAGSADGGDDLEDQVLGTHAGRRGPVHDHAHVPHLLHPQRLGGQDVLDLAGADAEGEDTERAVGARVGVAAHQGHPRLREAQLGSDHVGDAALPVTGRIQLDTEVGAVALHVLDLPGAFLDGRGAQLVVSRVLVVDRAEGELGAPGPATRVAQVGERHRRVDLVDELHVHVDQVRPSLEGGHRVTTPDLVRQSLGHQIAPSLYRYVTQILVGFLPTDKHVSPYRYQLRNIECPSRHHSRADTQSG